MIVSCTNCQTKYSADDSKIADKKFAFTCPNCDVEVIIDNREQTAGDALADDLLPGGGEEMEETALDDTLVLDEEPEPEAIDVEMSESDDLLADDLQPDEAIDSPIDATIMADVESSDEPSDVDIALDEMIESEERDMPMPELEDIDITGEELSEPGLDDLHLDDEEDLNLDEDQEIDADLLQDIDLQLDEETTEDLQLDAAVDLDQEIKLEGEFPREDVLEETGFGEDAAEETLGMDLDEVTIEEDIADEDEKITLDDLDEEIAVDDISQTAVEIEAGGDDLNLDLDNLDETEEIDISDDLVEVSAEDDTTISFEPAADNAPGIESGAEEFVPLEEEIPVEMEDDLDLNSDDEVDLDVDGVVDEISLEGDEFSGEEIKVSETGDEDMVETEKITVDDVPGEVVLAQDSAGSLDDDTDITIDLDSLDIQLEEIENGHTEPAETAGTEDIEEDEKITLDDVSEDTIQEVDILADDSIAEEEDEDITLDMDTLDLNLDETGETREGEVLEDDDERLSLSDAGLTPDQIVDEEEKQLSDDSMLEEEEDLKLSIDEVDAELASTEDDEIHPIFDDEIDIVEDSIDIDDLPEIDLDEIERGSADLIDDSEEIIPLTEDESFDETPSHIYADELDDIRKDKRDIVPRGTANVSIDYSLKYSRVAALLRICGLFIIGMIPHILVNIVYSMVALILGFINWFLVAVTGEPVEAFTEIQENTLRRLLAFGACYMDLVEELPLYSGREDIDYPLQFDVTYPVKYSRVLAILRLSVVGIYLLALPHILLLMILTIGSIPISIAGLICVLAKKTWPNMLFDPMVKYYNYSAKVNAFIIGLVDEYPKFDLE